MDLEKEIEKVKERNARVEKDKAWETSNSRKIIIAFITYLFMVLFMYSLKVENPFTSALIPTFGFTLSTLSLSFFKKIWLKLNVK